jgi:hypothetical protein
MSFKSDLQGDKIEERIILLKRFFGSYLEWTWPSEVKLAVSKYLGLPPDQPIKIEDLARTLSDGQIEHLIHISPYRDYYTFRGKYYTVKKGGIFEPHGAWEEVKNAVRSVLRIYGKKGYALLKALTEIKEAAPFDLISARASEIYGDRLYPSRRIAELKDVDLVWEVGTNKYPAWAMPEEIKPAVVEALAEFESMPIPVLRTKDAEQEFLEVIKMEEEFKTFLKSLVKERLEETIEFGKHLSPKFLIDYLQDLFGPTLFFDHLLSICQQYSICDADVVTEGGGRSSKTGFNLALFGEPGTGKTFATKDMILGNENQGIPPHGLPGINRYCGGMTPAKFIAIGEAYVGRRFNIKTSHGKTGHSVRN